MQEEKQLKKGNSVSPSLATAKQAPKKSAQKKKKKMSGGSVLCIILIIAIAGMIAAVYFDIGGAKQAAVSLLQLDMTTQVDKTNGEVDQTETKAREERLDQREADLNNRNKELDAKEDELDDREAGLSAREAAVSETEKKADEQREAYLASAAKIFESMDVKKAAKAIGGMETAEDMAQILLYMESKQAALIMDEMKSSVTIEILSEMMK